MGHNCSARRLSIETTERRAAHAFGSILSALSIIAGKFVAILFLLQLGGVGEDGVLLYLITAVIALGMSFGPIDLLFFFLAVGTAYKIASGSEDD